MPLEGNSVKLYRIKSPSLTSRSGGGLGHGGDDGSATARGRERWAATLPRQHPAEADKARAEATGRSGFTETGWWLLTGCPAR